MALKNSYDTVILQGYNLDLIKSEIDTARISNQLFALSDEVYYVVDTCNVTPFPAPIVHEGKVYVDARTFTAVERDGNLRVRDIVEHKLRLEQAQLELIWVNGHVNTEHLSEQFKYHREVLTKWICESVSFTYALNLYQQGQFTALVSLFTIGQFYNNMSEAEALRTQEMLAKQFYLNFDIYETVTGRLENLFARDINEFVESVKLADISPRLADFQRVTLLTLLGKSIWGVSNDTVLSTLAIEYPPALMAIIRMCIENTSFKRSKLGKVVDSNKSRNAHETFAKAYDYLIKNNSAPLKPTALNSVIVKE